MSNDLSEDMVRALFSAAPEPIAILLTLHATSLEEPLYFTNYPPGLTSADVVYEFFPFDFAWGGAGQTENVRATQLVIANSDARISQTIRTLPSNAQVSLDIKAVRVSSPDTVELAMLGARLSDAEVDDPKVTGTVAPKDFNIEPACAPRYTISRTPSLF